MDSRLLQKLNDDIGSARSLLEADCLRAQRAAYHARVGAFAEAEADLAALHGRYDGRPRAAISAWVHLAEGLRGYYTDLGPAARDKIQRAHAIASAAGLKPVRALCAAWLAHLAYMRIDADAIAQHAGQALLLATPDDHAAQSRVSLVVALGFDEAGRFDLAKPWYERARHHATLEGDDATMSALMWNMAALRVGQLRRRAADEPLDAATVAQARMRLDTTERYDEAHGVKSLQSLHRVLRAQLLTETGEYAQARALYDAHIDTALNEGLGAVAGTLMADQAWCRLQLGDRDGALDRARHAEAHLHQATIHGDRAPAHDRLAQIFGVLKREQEAARHRELAQAAWQGHADDQAHLLRALSTLQPHRPA